MSDEPKNYIITGADSFTIANLQPSNFVFQSDDSRVVIDMKTGKVTFENCTPDEAAKIFWDAVERYFPLRNER